MKSTVKITGIILALITILSVFSPAAFAAKEEKNDYLNDYPMIFVHGLNGWGAGEGINDVIPYWGGTTGNLMAYLEGEGYECYSASVGPLSSAWDRACELYAQLTGTTVDYGVAHSQENGHKRYGRTYDEPLFEGWGKKDSNGNIKKINLIGHSFGGTTIRMLTYLMTYGCAEEKNATKDGSLAPLFKGGKENWIESVTTIATPHNSATTYYLMTDTGLLDNLKAFSAMYAGVMGRTLLNGTVVDFHLEQFGITNTPGETDADEYFTAVYNFCKNSTDSCQDDLTPEGTKRINEMIKTSPNVYYFSYAFDTTVTGKLTGMTWPSITTNPVIRAVSDYCGHHRNFYDDTTGQYYDESWRANDALSNTISETYPFTEKHVEYDGTGKPQKGVWNVMPTQRGDHGQAIGLLADVDDTHKFYTDICEMLNKLK